MSVSPPLKFLSANESSDAQGNVRPGAGSVSTREIQQPQNAPSVSATPQDVVKVQMEPPGRIAVYQFVKQQDTLVLRV